MSILKPLVWSKTLTALSPMHEYSIRPSDSKFMVKKTRLATQKTETVTGFDSIDNAKKWCFEKHYQVKMQPYLEPDSIGAYFDKFTQWGLDRGIIQNGNAQAQGLKLVSEMGELADNLAKGRCIKDDIGDMMVVLNMLAQMTDVKIEDCLAQAWGDIKDRKGFMNEHGVFIKDGDV